MTTVPGIELSNGSSVAMNTLLEDITSGDAHRIWASACAIAKLRDTSELDLLSAHLAEIEAKTSGIPLGGALFSNSEYLKFALRKLRYHQAKAGCLCRLYPEMVMFNPAREEEAGNIRILDTIYSGQWISCYLCQCTLCATVFRVEEGDYHYMWWAWQIMEPNDALPTPND